MVMRQDRPFVYGRFAWPSLLRLHPSLPPVPSLTSVAIEILREFSATELVGKVYTKGVSGMWLPIDPNALSEYDWYKHFVAKDAALRFDMKPSGRWNVLNFRVESDESGPYVAVALKLASPQ
jgi:hypothetical protein